MRPVPIAIAGALFLVSTAVFAAEVIPPKPAGYFNDYAHIVSSGAASQFNEQLAQFERDTSNQVVVAIFPKMQSDDDIAAYTRRVAQTWAVGQKDKRNGAVLFAFIQDRKMFIQAGYGLEGALPDATCFDITEYQIKPHFRTNDYEGGITVGIDSILKAIRGEYKGSGRTVREQRGSPVKNYGGLIWFLIFIFMMFWSIRRARKNGYRYSSSGGPYVGWWGGGGGGGGWSSGGGGGGGFSGFSGGGGSFGGGGAGSSW